MNSTRRSLVMGLGMAILSACAAPPASPTVAPQKPTQPTPEPKPPGPTAVTTTAAAPPPTAKPPASPAATSAPVKLQIAKVALGLSAPGLGYAPVYLARAMKFFDDEAIDLNWQLISGGALTTAAVVNDEIQFASNVAVDQFVAAEKGLDLVSVVGITGSATVAFAARREFLEKKGVRPQSPVQDKINALRNSKIGIPTVSGGPTQMAEYLLKTNGINPGSDAEMIVVGFGAARVAALREGRVDSFIAGTTDGAIAENEGFGTVFINLGTDVPVFKEFMYSVLMGRRQWLEQNAGIAERFCRAVGRANNRIRSDLAGSAAALKPMLPEITPQVVDLDLQNIRTAFPADGRMTLTMWRNAAEVSLAAGAIAKQPPIEEGSLWTNKYLVNVPKQ